MVRVSLIGIHILSGREPHFVGTAPGRLRLLQHLHRFRQNQLAIHPLGSQEAHLTRGRVELVQAFEGAAFPVGHPVIAQIAEEDGLVPA